MKNTITKKPVIVLSKITSNMYRKYRKKQVLIQINEDGTIRRRIIYR